MSAPKRFFAELIPESRVVTLEGDEFLHAKNVLRISVGEEITLICGEKEYTAIVAKVEKRSMTCNIVAECVCDKNPIARIELLCGILKGDKSELVIQKATELGASKIGFFCSKFTNSTVDEKKRERFERVAREAAKQCKRTSVPQIALYSHFEDALQSATTKNKLIFCEWESASQTDFSAIVDDCTLLVGSEGGIDESEYDKAKAYGFLGMTLGKRILRAETAAISVMSLASYFLGELK